MGGFVLHPRLSPTEQWSAFPLDANQIHYLVTNNYIPYSAVKIELEEIKDKNKVDSLIRLITVCQILWYLVGAVTRAFQNISITILELSTIGFIFCSVSTYYFWFNKPMDVGKPLVLEANATIQEILLGAGDLARGPQIETPFDFATGRPDWSFSLCWKYCWLIMDTLRIRVAPRKWPIDKIPDDYFAPQPAGPMWILFIVRTGYAAVHISGWDLRFPSQAEKTLWRIATLSIMVSLLLFWFIHLCWWVWAPALTKRRRRVLEQEGKILREVPNKVFRDPYSPATYIPLPALIPVLLCSTVYILSRAYVILESFIHLRALPPSAYESVNWTAFLPHF